MSNQQDPGLPTPPRDTRKPRRARQFTLPRTVAESHEWRTSGQPSENLTFVIAEPSVDDEEEARRFAKGDMIKMADRLQDRCMLRIGGRDVNMNYAVLKDWKQAIGMTGRKLVEAKFLESFHISAEDEAEMEASGKEVFV